MAEELTPAIEETSPIETDITEKKVEPSVDYSANEVALTSIETPDNIDDLYNDFIKPNNYFSSSDEFRTFISDSKNAKDFFKDAIAPENLFSNENEFIQFIGVKEPGKPSAVPSASVDGGSATRKSGVVQPSSSQPRKPSAEQVVAGNGQMSQVGAGSSSRINPSFGLSPELQSAVSSIGATTAKQAEKYATEDAAFKDYERLQTYFAKVDKVKIGGIGSNLNRSGMPESQETINIRNDAFSGKYDLIKRQAEAAQAKMSESLKPIIEKDITEKFLKKNDDGFLVPDEEKIDQYAKGMARRYGLPENGFLKEVVYNEATSMAAFKEIEPEVNRRFEKLIQPNLVAPGLIEKANQEVWKNFTTDEVEQTKLDKNVGALAADLKVKSKVEEDAIQYEIQKNAEELNLSYDQTKLQLETQFKELERQHQNGLPNDQYNAGINNINKVSKEAFDAYTDERLKLFDQGQKSLNQISNKYNAQLRRQSEELNKLARERVNKAAAIYQKKYGKNPKLEAEIKKLYETAYLETVADKNKQIDKYNKDRTTGLILKYRQFGGIAAMADRFLRSIDSAAGGSLKGIGTSLGINSLQLYGDFLQSSVSLPQVKSKELQDLFDPMNLSQLSGQLIGGMGTTAMATAIVGATTRSAPLMYQMAATGVAAFFTETTDIAGRMGDETFARTQSAAKANEATEKSWSAQYKIMPLYGFAGLPFIRKAGTWMKTLPRVARMGLGAAAEILEEIPQEVSQNIAEENIRAEVGAYDNYYEKISEDDWKRVKETTISIAPVALLGAFGQMSGPRELSKKKMMEQQVKSYAAQAKVNELIGNMQGQWVSQMVAKKGDAFAVTTINALFADGTIDEQVRDELQEHVATSKKNFEDAKTLGLSESEGVVYDALTQAYLEKKAQYEQAQQNGDEILADNLNTDMTNIRNQAKEFAQNKQGDFFVFQFQDGSQKIVTNSKWSGDAEIMDLIASDQISVSAYSENGKALLDSLKPKVEEQKVAQKERKVKTLEDDIEVGDTVDLTPSAQPTAEAAPITEQAVVAETPTTETQKEEAAPVAEEAAPQEKGEFSIQGTFRGLTQVLGDPANALPDSQEKRNVTEPMVSETVQNGKKFFTLTVPQIDDVGRAGYLSVSLVLPETTTKTIDDVKDALDKKVAEAQTAIEAARDKGYNAGTVLKNKVSSEYTEQAQPTPATEAQAPIAEEAKGESEQAPKSFPAQEGAESEQKKDGVSAELEQIYRDLQKSVMVNVDKDTIRMLKENPTEAMVDKALRELERKGVIKIDCK